MKTKSITFLPIVSAIAVLMTPAENSQAAPVVVPNFSFEQATGTVAGGDGPTAGPNFTNQTSQDATFYPGWVAFASGTGVGYPYGVNNVSQMGSPGTSNGTLYAYVEAPFAGTTVGLKTAASLGTITANTTYTLTVALANGGIPSDDFGTLSDTLALTANGTPFTSSIIPDSTIPGTSTESGQSGGNSLNTFTDFTLTFKTGASGGPIGENLGIQISATNNVLSSVYSYLNADNVRLDAVVPEPSTYALMFVGLGFLAFGQRLYRNRVRLKM